VDYKDILSDIISHAHDFKAAIAIAKEHAEVRSPDIDDRAYWDKQLKTYERIEKVAKLMVGGEAFEPVGETNKEKFESLYDHANQKVSAFEAVTGVEDVAFKVSSLDASEQAAMAFGDFYYQIGNGGIQQYIDNGYALQQGANKVCAASFIARCSRLTSEVDEDVAAAVIGCAKKALNAADLNTMSQERFDRAVEDFKSAEAGLDALDEDRVFGFFLDVAARLEPSQRPFIEGLVVNEPVAAFTP
jgi:hypothetical protein